MISQKNEKTICKVNLSNAYSFLLALTVLLYSSPALSQEKNIMDNLAKELDQQAINKSKLSVYLQTSKDIYETGEDLWFKAYVLNAQNLYPSVLDKILYVQLEREDYNQVVLEEKYQIENGFVDGHIYIHDSLQTGNYRLAAYSSNSFNNTIEGFHSFQRIKIVDRISDQLKDKTREDKTIKNDSIHFSVFPEGGHLVSGLQSVVGFKAVDNKGLPKEVSGTIYENGKELLAFKSIHAGMGSFLLTPSINKIYDVRLVDSLPQASFELPKIETHGMVIQLLSNSKEELIFKVSQSQSIKKEIIYLRVQIRGIVYSIAKALLDKEIIIKIPIKDLPQGIAEITLFNENLQYMAERLVYVNQDQKLYIKTILDKSGYFTKEQAQLKIKVTDQNDKPIVAHLGLSIYDKIYKNLKDAKTVESHYQLSTQLKGSIYNPSCYFDDKNEDRKQDLNILMLTQGWRCYVWNEQNLKEYNALDSLYVKDYLESKLIYVKKRKDTPQQSTVAIYNPREYNKQLFVPLDSLGNFYLTRDHLDIGRELFIKHFSADKDRIKVFIKKPFNSINKIKETKNYIYPFDILSEKEEYSQPYINKWASMQKGVALDEVEIKGKKNHVFREKYLARLDSLAKLEMTTDYVCKIDNYLNCIIHPKSVKHSKQPIEGGDYQELIIFKNGSWVKAIEWPYPVGTRFNNPYILPYHYPVLTDENLLNIFNLIRVEGYYEKKEFYNPVYDNIDQINGFLDYRNTLFWKPDIITDESGEATVEFFCSDINTYFTGSVEGVSRNGLLGGDDFEFKVSKHK